MRRYSRKEFMSMPRKQQIAIIIRNREFRNKNPHLYKRKKDTDIRKKLNNPKFFFYDI